jgi:magnesium-transporting ATPase (P-type)
MITGDNPITASNIGYQSAILDPNTKTIIIDYSQSKFVEEEFSYNVKDLADITFSREPFRR